jgi:hypothetical protein
MNVVVPYTNLHPTTEFVLRQYPVEYVDVSEPDAYLGLLRRLWVEGATVIVVEHDVVPWPGALEEVWNCPCAWGSYSYHMHGGIGIYHGFGCTKLTAELMKQTPRVWEPWASWNMLDQKLFFAARAQGIEPHHHRPPVTHLNDRHY